MLKSNSNIFSFFRTATARGKAEHSDIAAVHAREDGQIAVKMAQQYQNEIDSVTPKPNPNQLRPEPIFAGQYNVSFVATYE